MPGSLPDEGELRLGPVRLPTGRWTYVHGSPREAPVAWVTSDLVAESGRIWSELTQVSARFGLVPFLARFMRGQRGRPWDEQDYFQPPADPAEIDDFDAEEILREEWLDSFPDEAEARGENDDEEYSQDEDDGGGGEDDDWPQVRFAPFTRHFPGLTPAIDQPAAPAFLADALVKLRPARIGLAVADRPADALAAMGWCPGNWNIPGYLEAAAVVRSWEDRFGARLLEVGMDSFKVLVERPPTTLAEAERIAVEHALFADEVTCAGQEGMTQVAQIAPRLLMSPIWGFWWD
jgi:hypothetical protein